MIDDAALPPGFPSPPAAAVERRGLLWSAATWNGDALAALAGHLAGGREALLALSADDLFAGWHDTVERFLDPASEERRRIDPALELLTGLSRAGVAAGLATVLEGMGGAPARALLDAARPADDDRPAAIILAGNLPALAVQPLLPALAVRRPVLVKSASVEPLFAPAFVAALARSEPRLAGAMAAVTWPGGDRSLEGPLLAAIGRVVAYGEADTLDDLERRAPGRVIAYGPRTSLAAIGRGVDPEAVADGLARDVALFDQRGCLSIQAIYTAGDAVLLATALAAALEHLAHDLPAGAADPATAAAVQQVRAEAELRGLYLPPLPIAAGTVVVEPLPEFRPSPGLRTVRVHPLGDLARLPSLLAPWSDRLQGAALAGDDARALAPALARLGVSRTAAPGELQAPDALWHNGGVGPLDALG